MNFHSIFQRACYLLAPAVYAMGAILLSGCASTGGVSAALSDPADTVKTASEVVGSAEIDLLSFVAMGEIKAPPSLSDLVCVPTNGPKVTSAELGLFSDALDTINKVNTKPDDTSFAGYVTQFRKNKAAIDDASAPPGIEKKNALEKELNAQDRCKKLFEADSSVSKQPSSTGFHVNSIAPFIGVALAVRDLATSLLQYGEAAQRAKAVQATIEKLIPQLNDGLKELAKDADPATFGYIVTYPQSVAGPAVEMSKSNLGAALTIRRWAIAHTINAIWDELKQCRTSSACIRSGLARSSANEFGVKVQAYRSLSKLDDKKILADLKDATEAADKASKNKSIAAAFDAVFTIGDAVSGIADKVDAVKKARDQ